VTGFVGGGHKPNPLTADEVNQILYRQTASAERPRPKMSFQRNDQEHRQPRVLAPDDLPVRPGGIELGAQHPDLVAAGLLPAQVVRVELGARAVARQEVVDRVKDPHPGWRA
jgi:transcription antitermination factor NusG